MAPTTVYLNPYPPTPGHFIMLNRDGSRVDGFTGPRDFMLRVYKSSGYDVRDENGRAVKAN